MKEDSVWFLLGRVKDDKHANKLAAVASDLDRNKFSCTFSIRGEIGCFDISPHEPQTVSDYDNFTLYAAELTIAALGRALGDKDNG
jgi:hypothetical protein